MGTFDWARVLLFSKQCHRRKQFTLTIYARLCYIYQPYKCHKKQNTEHVQFQYLAIICDLPNSLS